VVEGRTIDGADLSGLLLGRTKEAPRAAHFYFAGNELQAVRAGAWKLAVAPQSEGTGKAKVGVPEANQPYRPRLYNLDEDIGEAKDVATAHPEVVKRLQGLAAQMDADLGATKAGPGVRPPGKVDKPRPLLLKTSE
jgi:hypothetical protein